MKTASPVTNGGLPRTNIEAALPGPHPGAQNGNGAIPTAPPKRSGIGSIVKESRRGLQFDPRIPYEIWRALGERIAGRAEAASWWLGDWVVFGEQRYGARYRLAIEATGLDYQTLRNYAVVARRFELSRRRDNLSFQHHAEVCALSEDDQDQWLDLAAENHWSKRELRMQLRRAMRPNEAPTDSHMLRLPVDLEREQRWREAAASCQRPLEDWIVAALDIAASG